MIKFEHKKSPGILSVLGLLLSSKGKGFSENLTFFLGNHDSAGNPDAFSRFFPFAAYLTSSIRNLSVLPSSWSASISASLTSSTEMPMRSEMSV